MNDIQKGHEIVELEGIKVTRDQIELIKRTIFIGASDDEMRLFFYDCRRRGTHPMDRLIFPVVRKDKEGNRHVTFQCGIDYLRAAAEETGRYVGQKPVIYGPTIKQKTAEAEIEVPEWAEVTVQRKDQETGEVVEISSKGFWKEFYPSVERLGFMWRQMPHLMLSKCTESQALRKAFPRKLGGLYINEEMEQAEAVPFTPIQMPQEKKANGQQPPKDTESISEAQRKRFYAIAKSTKATDDQIKEWLYREYDIEHSKDIPKAIYDEICKKVVNDLSDSNAQ